MSVRAGFGRAAITPPVPVVLAGFGARSGPAGEVHDDLEVHALVVQGRHTLCLLVLDLLLLGPDYAGPVRAAVADALHVPVAHVLTSCTHTHAGPAATRRMRAIGWPEPPGYLDVVVAGCLAAARAALAGASDATFAFARAPLPAGLSLNRRGLPYQPEFAVLDVRRPDGGRIGSLANVAIHPVVLGITCSAVSADWPGVFRAAAAAASGAPAVLLSGALGDVNPVRDPHTDPDPGGNWESAAELGAAVSEAVVDQLAAAAPLTGGVQLLAHRVAPVPTGRPGPALLDRAGGPVEVELVEWALGDVRLVSVPGEAFHALGRRVEQARGDRALLAGLAPSWQGYLPEPFGQGYEERMSNGRRFVARVAELLTEVP